MRDLDKVAMWAGGLARRFDDEREDAEGYCIHNVYLQRWPCVSGI